VRLLRLLCPFFSACEMWHRTGGDMTGTHARTHGEMAAMDRGRAVAFVL
jgi:hypothetical protein